MLTAQVHVIFTTPFLTFPDAIFQMNEAATEAEICQFVMQSYRSFEQGIYETAFERLLTTDIRGGDGEPSTDMAWGNRAVADSLRGSSPHFIASLMPEPGEGSRTSAILGMMTRMLRTHSRQFQRLEHAADRYETLVAYMSSQNYV